MLSGPQILGKGKILFLKKYFFIEWKILSIFQVSVFIRKLPRSKITESYGSSV